MEVICAIAFEAIEAVGFAAIIFIKCKSLVIIYRPANARICGCPWLRGRPRLSCLRFSRLGFSRCSRHAARHTSCDMLCSCQTRIIWTDGYFLTISGSKRETMLAASPGSKSKSLCDFFVFLNGLDTVIPSSHTCISLAEHRDFTIYITTEIEILIDDEF